MTLALLDNIVWHSLSGPHSGFSAGTATARRYARGLSPLCGFADNERPDFDALAPFCEIGEHVFCGGWSGPAPSGWRVDADVFAQQMVWNGAMPAGDDDLAAVRLGTEQVKQMLELVGLTQPGPFGPRTVELGDYFGVFDDAQLIAMAGERMLAEGLREISGVCTHPDHQGRGLARRLMQKLIRLEMQRRLQPFLHVMIYNSRAIDIYERMGFRRHQQSSLRVICRE